MLTPTPRLRGVPLNHGGANPQTHSAGPPYVLTMALNFVDEGKPGAYWYLGVDTNRQAIGTAYTPDQYADHPTYSTSGFFDTGWANPSTEGQVAAVIANSGLQTDNGTVNGAGFVHVGSPGMVLPTEDFVTVCEHLFGGNTPWSTAMVAGGVNDDSSKLYYGGAGIEAARVRNSGSLSPQVVVPVSTGQVVRTVVAYQGGKAKMAASGGPVSTAAAGSDPYRGFNSIYLGNSRAYLNSGVGNYFVRRFNVYRGNMTDAELSKLSAYP